MDPLSEVFPLLNVESMVSARLEAGRGSCWISVTAAGSGQVGPGSGAAGDCFSSPTACRTAWRAYAASQQRPANGWLGALADPQIGAALELMHRRPARRQTVQARRLTRWCRRAADGSL
jgi:hypothetical protein